MDRKNLVRPLHRQRGRHRTVRVLGQDELAALLGVEIEGLAARLDALGWRYHRDSLGNIWATEQQPR